MANYSKYPHKFDRFKWIANYLFQNIGTDSCDQIFHDAYASEYPMYKRNMFTLGPSPVSQAMRDLAEMKFRGLLYRSKVNLGQAGPGFPRWTMVYTLSDIGKRTLLGYTN